MVSSPSMSETATSREQMNSRSKDLHGARLGDLVGECIVNTTARGHLWRLLCLGCGHHVHMYSFRVRQRFATWGVKLACNNCMEQESRTHKAEIRRFIFRDMWENIGSLYGTDWDDSEKSSLLLEFQNKIAPVQRSLPDPSRGMESEGIIQAFTKSVERSSHQRMADMYPIGNEDELYSCVHCEAEVHRGFGCVVCLGFVCIECVKREVHRHAVDDDAPTLLRVAAALGLTKQGVQQIQNKAIGAFVEVYRRFLEDEDPRWVSFADYLVVHTRKKPRLMMSTRIHHKQRPHLVFKVVNGVGYAYCGLKVYDPHRVKDKRLACGRCVEALEAYGP